MNVVPIRQRTLAHVLLDIEAAYQRCLNHQGSDIEGELLDRLWGLRSEARDMIEAATGIAWEQLQEANL